MAVNGDPGLKEYAIMALFAFCGTFMRAQRWQDANGKIIWAKVAVEIPVSISTGAIAIGVGTYCEFSLPIIGGIAGLMGLLGPAVIESILTNWLKIRFGLEKEPPK